MLIVLLDEPGLFVFGSPADAAREIEPIDAESEIRAAFDERGVPYRIAWLKPNRERRILFGVLKSVQNGKYELVPAGPAQPTALRELLERHPDHTQPPQAKGQLEALLAQLRAV